MKDVISKDYHNMRYSVVQYDSNDLYTFVLTSYSRKYANVDPLWSNDTYEDLDRAINMAERAIDTMNILFRNA